MEENVWKHMVETLKKIRESYPDLKEYDEQRIRIDYIIKHYTQLLENIKNKGE